jgi:hypothetical protein
MPAAQQQWLYGPQHSQSGCCLQLGDSSEEQWWQLTAIGRGGHFTLLVMTTTLPDLLLVPAAMAADSDPEGTCTLYRRNHHYCQDMARVCPPIPCKICNFAKNSAIFLACHS